LNGAPKEQEMNPMLGDHGVRFSLKHKDIMKSELNAIKILAEKYPNKIFGAMVPQLISLDELNKTKEIAKEIGIDKEKMKNVKIGIMVETPAAVQIINDLCMEGMDFISFGTNDLTQYMLAIDRNNEAIQDLYNEMNPAVLSAISYVIRRCKKYGVETSICGQAASKPEMAKFLVNEGIDSVSVNADAAYNISQIIQDIEKQPKKEGETKKFERELKLTSPIEAIKNLFIKDKEKEQEEKNKEDMESIILSELDENNKENQEKDGNDNYSPGSDKKAREKDIPPLNDAIPVESELFDDAQEQK
jgi:pyruvate,water dikinase